MSYSIVIPAYNEAGNIGFVLESLLAMESRPEIIVVDDGSQDATTTVVTTYQNVRLIHNETNLGQFASIVKGIRAATFDVVVTMDADGQHPVASLSHLVEPVMAGDADLVLGVRKELPRIGETIIAKVAGVTDATTGFRAFRKELVPYFQNDLVFGGMFVRQVKAAGYRVREVPVVVSPRRSGTSAHSDFNIFKKSLWFIWWSLRVGSRGKTHER